MKKKQKFLFLFSLLLIYYLAFITYCNAQISPPGLGASNMASWMALGVRQSLDSANKIQSFTYVGLGRTSGPASQNPYYRQALLVVNQEFYHTIHKHWRYSGAISYRNQNEYQDDVPYESATPAHTQELRVYGRYIYQVKAKRFKFVATYRQEFRSFFAPDFNSSQSPYQLRSRFRLQAAVTLDNHKVHRLSASLETLFSSSNVSNTSNTWATFGYKEARFCFYYSVDPRNASLIFNVGYMNDLIGRGADVQSVSYLALDVIWENPFKAFQREELKPIE